MNRWIHDSENQMLILAILIVGFILAGNVIRTCSRIPG
jgi:hypothetical protein